MRKRTGFLSFPAVFCLIALFGTPLNSDRMYAFADNNGEVSKAECVMELNSRRVLYELRGDMRLPMASTTKIVTAATVLSLCDTLQEEVLIPTEAEGVEGSSVYLKAGERYTVEELLYGLMLRSGNDCATALAYHFAGGIGNFSAKMNQTAQRAGALCSNFKNPHGLPCEGHYTTARDLTGITCFALQNPIFEDIVSTRYYTQRHWKNKNKLLYEYEGCIGVKTGYTKQAGRCLVSAARRKGMTLVCTVLGCSPMYERSATLLDDAFSAYRYETLLSQEEVFAVGEGKSRIYGYAKEDFSYPLLQEEKAWVEYKTKEIKTLEKRENGEKIIGQLEIYLAKRLLFSTNLYKL